MLCYEYCTNAIVIWKKTTLSSLVNGMNQPLFLQSFEEFVNLADKGDKCKVDVTAGDVFPTDYEDDNSYSKLVTKGAPLHEMTVFGLGKLSNELPNPG